jgi:hypothetical protein
MGLARTGPGPHGVGVGMGPHGVGMPWAAAWGRTGMDLQGLRRGCPPDGSYQGGLPRPGVRGPHAEGSRPALGPRSAERPTPDGPTHDARPPGRLPAGLSPGRAL